MPTYQIEGPDGRTFEIDTPEGASHMDALNKLKTEVYGMEPPGSGVVENIKGAGALLFDTATGMAEAAATGIGGLVAGAGEALTGGSFMKGFEQGSDVVRQTGKEVIPEWLRDVPPSFRESRESKAYEYGSKVLELPHMAGEKVSEFVQTGEADSYNSAIESFVAQNGRQPSQKEAQEIREQVRADYAATAAAAATATEVLLPIGVVKGTGAAFGRFRKPATQPRPTLNAEEAAANVGDMGPPGGPPALPAPPEVPRLGYTPEQPFPAGQASPLVEGWRNPALGPEGPGQFIAGEPTRGPGFPYPSDQMAQRGLPAPEGPAGLLPAPRSTILEGRTGEIIDGVYTRIDLPEPPPVVPMRPLALPPPRSNVLEGRTGVMVPKESWSPGYQGPYWDLPPDAPTMPLADLYSKPTEPARAAPVAEGVADVGGSGTIWSGPVESVVVRSGVENAQVLPESLKVKEVNPKAKRQKTPSEKAAEIPAFSDLVARTIASADELPRVIPAEAPKAAKGSKRASKAKSAPKQESRPIEELGSLVADTAWARDAARTVTEIASTNKNKSIPADSWETLVNRVLLGTRNTLKTGADGPYDRGLSFEEVKVIADQLLKDAGFAKTGKATGQASGAARAAGKSVAADLLEKDAAFKERMARMAKAKGQSGHLDLSLLTDMLGILMRQAKSGREYVARAKNLATDAASRARLEDIARGMWANKERQTEIFNARREAVETNPELAAGFRTMEDIVGRGNELYVAKDDIGKIAAELSSAETMHDLYRGRKGEFIRVLHQQINDKVGEGQRWFVAMRENLNDYMKLDSTAQQNIMTVWSIFEKGRLNDALKARGMMWPDEAMLRRAGLQPDEVGAMQKLFKVFDEGFEIMDMLRAKQGLPSVPRLPGYMPHVWVGDYQVQFHVRDVNGNARKVVRRYKTQKQAEAAVKAFEEEGFTIEAPGGQKVQARTQRDIGGDFFDSIAETLERFDHDSFIDKKIRERIQKSEYNSFKSFLGSEIERVPGDVGGYLNEMGRYATDRFADGKMAREMAARIREIPVRYTQAIADFYKDTLLRSEVLKPIQEAEARGMFKYTPNLLDYAKKRIHRNLEKDYLSELGVAVEKALSKLPAIEVGNTRTTVRDVIKGLTTWTYWSKLFVKPAYAVTNVLQPVLGIARVMAFEAEALVRGAPGGNVAGFLKTLSRLDKVYKNFAVDDFASVANFDRYVNEGLAYLEASGRLETISATHEMRAKHKMELQPAGIRGKIQSSVETFHKRIENAGRRITAAAFIEYYRKMYPNNPKAAYDAAARAMSQTMGEFSEGSVAAIYAHAGTVSELARPFTNLKHMYLGNVVNSVKLMAEAKKTHGALSKEMAASAGALLGGQLVIGTLAGVGGLVLYQEAKALYELINRWLFNGQGGDFDEAVRDHLPSGLVGEIVTYGVPAVLAGQATGGEKPPLGQMMGMPQMNQLPLPVPPAGQTAWDIIRALWTTGKAAAGQAGIGTPVPGRDVAQAVSRIAPKAPFLTGRLETQFGDVSQGPYGGQVRRTEDQQAVLDLWGQKASSETEEQQRVFGLRQARRGQADVLEDSAASIVDGLLGAQNRDPGQIYVMLIEKGYSSREIEGAIKREISRQEFSAAEGITKGASSGDWARRVRLMDLMSRFKVGPYDTTSTE